jgi:hypothetical protein
LDVAQQKFREESMPNLEPMEIKVILNALQDYITYLNTAPQVMLNLWTEPAKSALLKMKQLDDAAEPVV